MEKPCVRLFTQLFQHILLNYSKDITKWVCGELFVMIFTWTVFVTCQTKTSKSSWAVNPPYIEALVDSWRMVLYTVWQITMNLSLYHGYELSTIFCLGRMTYLLLTDALPVLCYCCHRHNMIQLLIHCLFSLQKCIWKNFGPAKPQFPSSKLKNIYQTFCWEREDIQELQKHWCARKVATRGWCPCSSRCNQTLALAKDNCFFTLFLPDEYATSYTAKLSRVQPSDMNSVASVGRVMVYSATYREYLQF